MAASEDARAAVLRKLNVTWDDEVTAGRVNDVIDVVAPTLSARLGLPADHDFERGDTEFGLFLSACLYEFSDALDDFWENYRRELDSARLLRGCAGEGGGDAEA